MTYKITDEKSENETLPVILYCTLHAEFHYVDLGAINQQSKDFVVEVPKVNA